MLTIVQHQEVLAWAQEGGDSPFDRLVYASYDLQCSSYCRSYQFICTQRRQINKDRAIRELRYDIPGNSHGQARLADSSGARKREQGNSFVEEQRPGHCTLSLPADKASAEDWQ